MLSAIKIKNDLRTERRSKMIKLLAVAQSRFNKTRLITMRPLSAMILKKDRIALTVATKLSQCTLITVLQFTKYKNS